MAGNGCELANKAAEMVVEVVELWSAECAVDYSQIERPYTLTQRERVDILEVWPPLLLLLVTLASNTL